jgi:hypothetical protein
MALSTFGGFGNDPFAMMDPLFFDSARGSAFASQPPRV